MSLLFEYYSKENANASMNCDISWQWMKAQILSRGHEGKFHPTHLATTKTLRQSERSIAAWLANGKRDKNEVQRKEPRNELTDEEKQWLASKRNPFNRMVKKEP